MKNAKGTVDVVIVTFSVVVGVALERFLTDQKVFSEDFVMKPEYWCFYGFSFTALICLALRFLVGSDFHLKDSYVKPNQDKLIFFFKDLIFLVVFGVLLVQAALSKNPRDFMSRLAWFLGLSVIWDLIEWRTRRRNLPLTKRWLKIDFFQLAGTCLIWYCYSQVGVSLWAFAFFAILAVGYCLALWFDLGFLTSRDPPATTP